MRKLTLFLLSLFAIIACEEKDLTDQNPSPSEENVYLATSFLYGGKGIFRDSSITNERGQTFFITEVKVAMSDFHYYQFGDTLGTVEGPFVVSMAEPLQDLVQLSPGGYSGYYSMELGVDSLTEVAIMDSSLSSDHELVENNMLWPERNAIHNVIIRGRLLDPEKPEDTTGTIDLEYMLSTYITNKKQRSVQKNFSLVNTSDVQFVLHVDLEPIFNEFDLEARPTVKTDITNQIEYSVAQEMADSLFVRLF